MKRTRLQNYAEYCVLKMLILAVCCSLRRTLTQFLERATAFYPHKKKRCA
jgi:hypothetical protein